MRSRVRQRRAENNTRHVREFQQDFNAFSWFKNYLQSGCFEIFLWYRSILLFFSGWNIISSLSGVRKSNPHRDLVTRLSRVQAILDTEHLLETNYELSTWNSFVSFARAREDRGVLRHRVLDFENSDMGQQTSMTRWQQALTSSLN